MKVFIDTNTYLSFLGPESNLLSLLEFRKLLKEKSPKFELIVNQQIFDEYERNLGKKIDESRQEIKKELFDIKLTKPSFVGEKIDKDIEKIREKVEGYRKEKLKEIEKHLLETEEIIKEIFSLGVKIEINDSIIKRAQERYIRGNPPRKKSSSENNTSYGDAINWECMVSLVDDDLVIVSFDLDYAEPSNGDKVINRFLKKEWEEKDKTIKLYTQLGIFINTLKEEPVIPKEAIEKEIRSSDTVFIEKPLTYRITTTEERIFPNSSIAVGRFGGTQELSQNNILINEGSNINFAGLYRPTSIDDSLGTYRNTRTIYGTEETAIPGTVSWGTNLNRIDTREYLDPTKLNKKIDHLGSMDLSNFGSNPNKNDKK